MMNNNIGKPKMTHYRWWVMSFIFVTYTVANADRANIGFAIPFIQEEFQISNTMAGLLISLFFAGYAFFQIPAGYLIKKFGMRNAFAMGMLLTSVFTGLMGMVNNIFLLKILRFMVGICESPVVIGSTVTINQWFPRRKKGQRPGCFWRDQVWSVDRPAAVRLDHHRLGMALYFCLLCHSWLAVGDLLVSDGSQ